MCFSPVQTPDTVSAGQGYPAQYGSLWVLPLSHSFLRIRFLKELNSRDRCESSPYIGSTATSIFDMRAATRYAAPGDPLSHQEAAYVTSLSDYRRRLRHAHV